MQVIINAIQAHCAILASDGTLLTVNNSWRAFERACSLIVPDMPVGTNYFTACARFTGACTEDPSQIVEAMREVGLGQCDASAHEYAWTNSGDERWFRLRIVRIEPRTPAVEYLKGEVSEARFEELAALAPRMIVFDQDVNREASARATAPSPRILLIHREITHKKRGLLAAKQRFVALTRREREILDMLSRGQSSKEIAASQGVSVRTVENHRYRILAKTQAKNVADLTRLALLAKIIHPCIALFPALAF